MLHTLRKAERGGEEARETVRVLSEREETAQGTIKSLKEEVEVV
jgi:hypothetical protein